MTAANSLPPDPPRGPGPTRHIFWRTIGSVALLIGGAILLFPGLCAIAFAIAQGSDADGAMWTLWFFCLAISFGGGMLIWRAVQLWRGRA